MEPRAGGEETVVLAASAASLYAWRNPGAGAEDDDVTTETGSGGRARASAEARCRASPIGVGFGSVLPPLFGEVFARSIGFAFVASIDPSCRGSAVGPGEWAMAAGCPCAAVTRRQSATMRGDLV